MLKQKTKIYSGKLSLAIISATILVAGVFGSLVLADQFEEQIKQLQAENAGNKASVLDWAGRASSYQDAIDKLEQEIRSLQQSIVDNQRRSDELQTEIDEAQAELDYQKSVLGQNIKAMYIESKITTLEILASSKNLSDFVDKEQARVVVQNKVKTTVDKITDLKLQLQTQKRELEARIKDLQSQQLLKDQAQAEQTGLLAYSNSQKVTFESAIKNNNNKIAELRRQQAIENAKLFGGGAIIKTSRCDIYPQNWCNAPMDSIVDTWGMFNRECVSWTAYRVAASGRYMPYWGGRGNANQWDDNARAAGIPVDRNPMPGDVAVSNSGYYGHTMYVEAVHEDGTIAVSQFNHDWGGTYSFVPKMNIGNLVFIHFQ